MRGTIRREKLSPRTHDLTGRTFGQLIVTSFVGYYYAPDGQRYPVWRCSCSCGARKRIRAGDLRSGRTVSCGCHRNANNRTRFITHGHDRGGRRTKEYRAWAAMIQRCYSHRNFSYPDYGGRGIQVCEAWRRSFAVFLADVGPAPSPAYTLDRINRDGHYEPGNVRWATRQQQACNTRRSVLITFRGETLPLSTRAERMGTNASSLAARFKLGWTIEEALTIPFRYGNRRTH